MEMEGGDLHGMFGGDSAGKPGGVFKTGRSKEAASEYEDGMSSDGDEMADAGLEDVEGMS